jgi:cupin fold WbuC family metalloprotein
MKDREQAMKMNRVDAARLARVIAAAKQSPRRRMNDNLHAMDDAVHRLLNATEPGTYVQPHRHAAPPKTETLCVLSGRGAILTFDDDGEVIERAVLGACRSASGSAGGSASADASGDARRDVLAIEIPPATWHTLIALESGTVWFEVKEGPYAPLPPQDIAPWSPAPGTRAAEEYLLRLCGYAGAP